MALTIVNHPLVQHKIAILREKGTGAKEFRELVEEIATFLCYEATRDAELTDVPVETPLSAMIGKQLTRKAVLVPILRAGLGMVGGMLHLLPTAEVGHIGLYRDPDTLEPVEYYCKQPTDIASRDVFLLDPMLATGGSASAALTFLKARGATRIKFLCVIAAEAGVARVQKDHPEVPIFAAAYDKALNDHAYIVPGLGDAGDRLFGTK